MARKSTTRAGGPRSGGIPDAPPAATEEGGAMVTLSAPTLLAALVLPTGAQLPPAPAPATGFPALAKVRWS